MTDPTEECDHPVDKVSEICTGRDYIIDNRIYSWGECECGALTIVTAEFTDVIEDTGEGGLLESVAGVEHGERSVNRYRDDVKRMSDEEYEYTFDPMDDLSTRWGITLEEAEVYLEKVGYFDTDRYHEIAETFSPTDPESHDDSDTGNQN